MAKIRYEKWKPGGEALDVLVRAEQICTDYERQGYDLTLRQLYYQFVSRALIPNNQKSYDRLGIIVNKGRLAGYIDWNHITDRTRNLSSLSKWSDPASIIDSAASSYHIDLWSNQERRVEVWVEKEALAGIVGQAADQLDCAWFSCRGYVSQSEMWGASQRIGKYLRKGQAVTVLHLGDHDPSGLDMSRDIEDRLRKFVYNDWYREGMTSETNFGGIGKSIAMHTASATPFEVHRIALNMEQVEQYTPPPNPAKISDSRAKAYIDEYGAESWELDALDPAVLDALITEHIEENMDRDLYDERVQQREDERHELTQAAERWPEVRELVTQ